jgi:perosamine synthetase
VVVGSFRSEEFEGRDSDDFHRLMPESLRRRLIRQRSVADAAVARRRRVGQIYEDGFRRLGIKTPVYPLNSDPVLLRYPVLVNDKPAVLAEAQRAQVEIGDWFSTPIHPVPPSQWPKLGYRGGSCPTAEQVSRQIITLPVHAGIDERQAARTLEFVATMDRAGRIAQKTAKNASKVAV